MVATYEEQVPPLAPFDLRSGFAHLPGTPSMRSVSPALGVRPAGRLVGGYNARQFLKVNRQIFLDVLRGPLLWWLWLGLSSARGAIAHVSRCVRRGGSS